MFCSFALGWYLITGFGRTHQVGWDFAINVRRSASRASTEDACFLPPKLSKYI